jgi:hypothetical protein
VRRRRRVPHRTRERNLGHVRIANEFSTNGGTQSDHYVPDALWEFGRMKGFDHYLSLHRTELAGLKLHEAISTLDGKCAEIFRGHPFYKAPDLAPTLRRLVERPDLQLGM